MENKAYANIPKEKFNFVKDRDRSHDAKLETKARSYMRDAFSRFCKNKASVVGAVIIIALVLFAIIAPFCTPYTAAYNDTYFRFTLPKNELFAQTNFWDGCSAESMNKQSFDYYYYMGEETGHNAVKNQQYQKRGSLYSFRLDSYHKTGCIYYNAEEWEYELIQQYQDETNIQVIYPTVSLSDRPSSASTRNDANYYYKTQSRAGGTEIVYDADGNIIPVYASHPVGEEGKDGYHSIRVEGDGEGGVEYEYARRTDTGYEIRVNYYEYYIFYHS